MHSDTNNYTAGLKAADAIVKAYLDNIAGEHSSAARIERAVLRRIRGQFKESLDSQRGKINDKM